MSQASPTAVIVHLSGPTRGRSHRLRAATVRVGTAPDVELRIAPPRSLGTTPPSAWLHAITLNRRGGSYELQAAPGLDVWVNGEPTERIVLASGDVIELGRGAHVLRFRLYRPGSRAYKSMSEAFSDCVDCARLGGSGTRERVGLLVSGTARELATQVSPWTRVGLILLIGVVLGSLGTLWFRQLQLERRVEVEADRFDMVARVIEDTIWDAPSTGEFEASREALTARLDALEHQAGARERTISAASGSVVFLQSAYGFLDGETSRPLRFLGVGAEGRPLTDADGLPRLTLDGDGPRVEVFVTGTAFVVDVAGLLLTNNHVAQPWEFDEAAQSIVANGFRPALHRFIGWIPGDAEPLDLELLVAADSADIAVVRADLTGRPLPVPLELTDVPPDIGDEVVVLGYPAGIRALLARTEPAAAEAILAGGSLDFWGVARELAAGGYVEPLATVGVVGQVTRGSVVYDAETTHGGSGGPVLDLDGRVVAVNTAILPEFGGSNLGVPAATAMRLLAREGD